MAVKTQAQLLAEVASLLADNTTGDISASDVRTCLNDIIDSASYGGSKVYKALLTQTGTDAPVATVLVNTLSGTPVWSYDSAGAYFLTLASEFTAAKTSYNITVNSSVNDIFTIQRINDDYFYIATASLTAGTYVSADDFLVNTPITIEVYP